MSTQSRDIQTIIERLNSLSLERQRIAEKERALLRQATLLTSNTGGQPDPAQHGRGGRISPIEDEFVDAEEEEGVFEVGDHIYIENRIRHVPFRLRPAPQDRTGIEHRVTEDRVYLRTYNGYDTWRNSRNVRRLSESERENLQR